MTLTRRIAAVALAGLLMAGPGPSAPHADASPSDATSPATTPASEQACTPLAPREQAAQLVMSGIPGTVANEDSLGLVASDAGSVIVMPPNVDDYEQVVALLSDLRAAAPVDLLTAVDEEGGRVARLAGVGDVPALPPARDLAQAGPPTRAGASGRALGAGLAAIGIDLNLAPVLDVTDAPDGSVIGDRAFAADARRVARYGRAFADGLRAGGVAAAGKHFPGHGRTDVDSHETLPAIDASMDALAASDLHPFRAALPSLDAVMTAHVVIDALDEKRPASLSPAVHELLRDEWGFDGLIITDALEMGAITDTLSIPEAAEQAIAAGADLALVAGAWKETEAVTDRLVDAMASGRIPEHRWQASVRRVLRAKGVEPSEATCLLGLPAVGDAGVVATDQGVATVVNGRMRPLPDRWRLQRPASYDPAELERLESASPIACLAGGCGRGARLTGLLGH